MKFICEIQKQDWKDFLETRYLAWLVKNVAKL